LTIDTQPTTTRPSRTKRRVWTAVALLVLLLTMAIAPPLINANRLKRRIAASISASLGRPVSLGKVTMHLLPVPGFTLEDLVVNEDPAFGYEPTIRAMKVDVTLRPSSLWRRQVEIASIKFDVDDTGSAPSLNLVRNAQGKWNLQGLLMHATNVDMAPTVQQKAGPAPRFPYVEATGVRVNVKIDQEKKAFSLTEAEFALWQPEPGTFRLRVEAKPARTDSNISDPGVIRIEGSLQRAATMADVPVNLSASWHEAPLGEASKLLTGEDAYWRGALTVDATLAGKLGAAKLTTGLHLRDLRRADFVPAKTLDVDVACAATADVTTVTLTDAACTVPIADAKPLKISSPHLDLNHPRKADITVVAEDAPLPWAMDWARLFSQRIPSDLQPQGTLNGSATWNLSDDTTWTGGLTAALTSTKQPLTFAWTFAPEPQPLAGADRGAPHIKLALAPVTLKPADGSLLALSGALDFSGYTLLLDGNASLAQVRALANLVPPLSDGLNEGLPPFAEDAVRSLDIACTRLWGAAQQCGSAVADKPGKKHRRSRSNPFQTSR
jgi:hypothetical protein